MFGRLSAFERASGEAAVIAGEEACRSARRQPRCRNGWVVPDAPEARAGPMPPARAETVWIPALRFASAGMTHGASEASSPSGVEEIVDGPRRRGVHACRLDEVLVGGALDRLDGAEMVQERALAVRADTRDLVERSLCHLALALGPMRPDREAVRLVAQALHEIELRIARRQLQRRLSGQEEGLAAGVAVAPLGDADEGHIVDADLRQRFARRLELPLAAVDEHEVGPGRERVVLLPSPLRGGVRGGGRGHRAV